MRNIFKLITIILITWAVTACNNDNASVNYPEIQGIENQLMLIENETQAFQLSGGDEKNFEATIANTDLAMVHIDGKTLTITTHQVKGETTITIKSADKVKTIRLSVETTPELGVYKNGVAIAVLPNVVRNGMGTWLTEVAGNPYEGKRLFIGNLPNNIGVGGSISALIKARAVDGLSDGEKTLQVQKATADIIKLATGEYSIVLPRN